MTATTTATLPTAGTWVVDASHSSIEAVAKHLVVSKVRGRFSTFEGTIVIADQLENSTVDVTIQAASIDTNDAKRDEHLRSEDFLDVETHPTLTFRSDSVKDAGDGEYVVPGELTIRGVTRPVELEVTYLGLIKDPWGNDKAGFSATTTLDREEFGITWNAALETGGVLVGKNLKIEIDLQLAQAQA
ncbi:MAG: YceI family protein [Actinobacteria bacterium]|jgi:polyisoprenoid-binding protein YceI|nr:YceI family protein [Actinomycetota bacterium]